MIVIVVPFFHYSAMALYPFLIIKKKEYIDNKLLLNHEHIHFAQQKELLFLGFYILYLLNYLINLFRYFNHDKAYRNIVFEREAFMNEKDFNYLKQRKMFACIVKPAS